jgi:hypothetical protein
MELARLLDSLMNIAVKYRDRIDETLPAAGQLAERAQRPQAESAPRGDVLVVGRRFRLPSSKSPPGLRSHAVPEWKISTGTADFRRPSFRLRRRLFAGGTRTSVPGAFLAGTVAIRVDERATTGVICCHAPAGTVA